MKNILVIGLGVSGRAIALFMLKKGFKVFAVDDNLEKLKETPLLLQELIENGIRLCSSNKEVSFSLLDTVIVSPGIPTTHYCYQKAEALNIEILGETALAFKYLDQPCVAITGTNGKTTVTSLVEHVLKGSGIKTKALGNIGTPLATYLLNPDLQEVLVVELSSYQLETMEMPVFSAGVILNITPDHLDRYASMEEYAMAKCRLKKCIKKEGTLYISEDVERDYKHLLSDTKYVTYGTLVDSFLFSEEKPAYELSNEIAAWHLCKSFGVTEEMFLTSLATFKKPSHRVEFVKEINGVMFYDDSKGTNIDAVIKAVEAMKGPVILIAGGVDKGASYAPWKKTFLGKVKKVLVIGEAADKITRELSEDFDVEKESTLESAVSKASTYAQRGDSVLLSPGCSSFDMFRDYAHRGAIFKQCVNTIDGGENIL